MTASSENKKKLVIKLIFCIIAIILTILGMTFCLKASADTGINVDINSGNATDNGSALDILFMLAFLALLPTMLLMVTSFTRIIISLSFLRSAIGTQSAPPNQVLIGIAVFLTFFIMSPVISQINTEAYQPYKAQEITQEEAIDAAKKPIKQFMLKQVYDDDLDMFMNLAADNGMMNLDDYKNQESLLNLGLRVVIPAFITSELKRAFLIGFLLYIPFLIIDIVVSSTLMSMGMVMLPPSMISMPFKLMLFILVNGWSLLIESLVAGFR